MTGSVLACALLACGAAPGPPVPADQAPPPRLVKPDVSLVLVENVSGEGGVDTRRAVRVGVRNGKLLPPETVWEGDQRFFGHFGGHRVVADRYLVTKFGGVIDLQNKKRVHDEQDGEFCAVEGTQIIYRNTNGDRVDVFAFDPATGKAQKAPEPIARKYALKGVRSPDGTATVESGPVADELFLNQPDEKPKSLGKGFRIDISPMSSVFGPVPVAWLNNGTFVTQKGNGKLVTVDVTGKVVDLLTIKDAPKDLVSAPYFFRDAANRLVYVCRGAHLIDPDKKTVTKYEWRDLGHGFEISWAAPAKVGYTLRLNGKEIGRLNCLAHTVKTAPGYLAVETRVQLDDNGPPDAVAVWAGEWHVVKMWPNDVVGWAK